MTVFLSPYISNLLKLSGKSQIFFRNFSLFSVDTVFILLSYVLHDVYRTFCVMSNVRFTSRRTYCLHHVKRTIFVTPYVLFQNAIVRNVNCDFFLRLKSLLRIMSQVNM